MKPETAIGYIIRDINFTLINLRGRMSQGTMARIGSWWRFRVNRMPYWSDHVIAESALSALERARDTLIQSKGGQS